MREYLLESVWPEPSDLVQAEVVDFWLAEAAMPEGVARERARQLIVMGRDPNTRAVAAVSTAVPHFVETLGLRCFYFRAFVGKAHRTTGLRGSNLIQPLIRLSYDLLNERFQHGHDQDVAGLYLEIQNASILRNRREVVWNDMGACISFVGVMPNGNHARVWYFENACLPDQRHGG